MAENSDSQQPIRPSAALPGTPPQLPANSQQHQQQQSYYHYPPPSHTPWQHTRDPSELSANGSHQAQQSSTQSRSRHTSPPIESSSNNLGGVATTTIETTQFVRPSDLLRPRAISKPVTPAKPERSVTERHVDRPIDRDERAGLRAIRTFLRVRNCYEVLPLSFRTIELDVGLTVKESLNILVQCGIVSAPLWDSQTSTYAGLLTVNDYLNVVRYYNLHADKLKDVDSLLLSDLREVERILNVKAPETISTSPETVLYDALRKQLSSRARRIPLVSYDSESQRLMVVSVITQYRILKFISMNVGETDMLRKPLSMIKLGTYENLVRCSMETIVLDVIDEMVTRNISSVPVVTTDGVLLNVFEAVDVIEILKTGDYGNLTWTIGRALAARQPNHPGIYTCSMDDGLDTILDTIRKSRVHRLTIVDEHNYLTGVLSLSDILHYILVAGPEDPP